VFHSATSSTNCVGWTHTWVKENRARKTSCRCSCRSSLAGWSNSRVLPSALNLKQTTLLAALPVCINRVRTLGSIPALDAGKCDQKMRKRSHADRYPFVLDANARLILSRDPAAAIALVQPCYIAGVHVQCRAPATGGCRTLPTQPALSPRPRSLDR